MTDEILTISVPEAGRRYFGLSRNGSYAAAARGEIPVIKVGRLKRVPVRAMEAKLDKLCRQGMPTLEGACARCGVITAIESALCS